ncbi:CBS-domain Sds23p [Bipolaris maydis]|nr:CBS-domain Sds23p [Bipolaris maydis]
MTANAPTLINLPPPPSGDETPGDAPDRISRLAGLERVAVSGRSSQGLNPGVAANHPPAYFDANNQPQLFRERSTVGSASATGSVGGRTTWASGSDVYEPDRMSEDQDMDTSSMGGFSDEAASLVGFGEGARTPARHNSQLGSPAVGKASALPGYLRDQTPVSPMSSVGVPPSAGSTQTMSSTEQQKKEARMMNGMTYDDKIVDTASDGPVASGRDGDSTSGERYPRAHATASLLHTDIALNSCCGAPHPAIRNTRHIGVATMTDRNHGSDTKNASLSSSTSSIGRNAPPALKMGSAPSPHSSHRSSFAEHMRGAPTASHNPPTKGGDSKFQGRDWKTVRLREIVDPELVRFVEYNTSVEDATNILVKNGAPNVVLLREDTNSRHAVGTFDYSDLNAYLLLVVGLAQPEERDIASFDELARKGREGKPIPLKDVKEVGGNKEPLITLDENTDLCKAIEVFGSGIHRILVVEEGSQNVVGILTQLRLVQFFWENRSSFPAVNQLYPQLIKDLDLGSKTVMAINGDKPLAAALELMNNEGVSSLPVLDAQNNVIGNISQVDVRLLTKSTSLPLLRSSCIHFISVILSERGVNDGKDSFPVFHVNPYSTLAHTVAKLVATRSHRMWVVDAPSPASSGPSTPAITPAIVVPPSPITPLPGLAGPTPVTSTAPTHLAATGAVAPSISASAISAMPGASLSGRLSGVISLTDILNLFARASGLNPHDPDEARRARRRSSSSSMRRSMDSSRSESISAIAGRRSSVSEREKNGPAPQGLGISRGRGP